VDGDIVDVSLSLDGTRILVATDMGNDLFTASFAAGTLEKEADPAQVTSFPNLGVSLSGCMLAWTEARTDGSGNDDIRYTFLGDNGTATGNTHIANINTDDNHAPTSLCLSSTRIFMTFFTGGAKNGSLNLRAIPTPLLTP
jgi:hypothetical protein